MICQSSASRGCSGSTEAHQVVALPLEGGMRLLLDLEHDVCRLPARVLVTCMPEQTS